MYLFIAIFFTIAYCFCCRGNQNTRRNYIVFVTIILILLSALRHPAVGNDTYGYIRNLLQADSENWKDILQNFVLKYTNPGEIGKDPGYALFNKLISIFSTNSVVLFLIVAAILMIPFGIFVYRNVRKMAGILFAYLFYLNFFYSYLPNSAIRQSIALACVLVGYLILQSTTKKKLLKFVLFVLLASFFHKSALVALLFPLSTYIINPKYILRLGLIGFIAMLFLYPLVGGVLSGFSDVYEMYGENSFYGTRHERPYLVIILFGLFYIIALYAKSRDKDILKHNDAYVGAALTMIFLPLIWMDPSAIRISAYFGIWFCVLIPYSVDLVPKSIKQMILILVLSSLILRAGISPSVYKFNWQKMQLHERW